MATSTVSPGDHFFEADGIQFHYLVRGSGPLMIFQSVGWGMPAGYLVHGMGPHLEKKNTVLYFEPRGNGESSKPADENTMTAKTMAEDLEHLRTHLGLEALPVLAGGSHAGAIALRYAERYPSRVAKLVLFAAQVMDSPANTNFQDWMAKRKDDPAFAPAVERLMSLGQTGPGSTDEEFRATMDTMLPIYFSNPTKTEVLRRHVAAGPTLPALYGFQTNMHDSKPENQLPHVEEAGKVKAKTLIIWGAEDVMCSLTAARALEQGIPGSKLVIIPGVGHCAYIEKPDEFWHEVDVFLES